VPQALQNRSPGSTGAPHDSHAFPRGPIGAVATLVALKFAGRGPVAVLMVVDRVEGVGCNCE
jgi:hypothetical protein